MPEITVAGKPADQRWKQRRPKYLKRIKDASPRSMDLAAKVMLKRARLCAQEGVPFEARLVCYGATPAEAHDAAEWMAGVFHRFGFAPTMLLGDTVDIACEDIDLLRQIAGRLKKIGQAEFIFVNKYKP